MKAINGNLDMSKKYKLIDVEYGELSSGAGECCQNCGNLIANVAIVEREDGNKYRIGLDCMTTIIHMNPLEAQEAKNQIARERKLYKHLATECKCIITHGGDNDTAWSYKRCVTAWDSFWKFRPKSHHAYCGQGFTQSLRYFYFI